MEQKRSKSKKKLGSHPKKSQQATAPGEVHVKVKEKFVVLERGRDFSLTALANYLNDKFCKKQSGKPFATIDVQKYAERGHLPAIYGGLKVTEYQDDMVGVKGVRLGDPVEVKKGKRANK